MRTTILIKAFILVLAVGHFGEAGTNDSTNGLKSVKRVAEPFPQRNDITMRTLRFREVPEGHPKDPFAALEAFYANRLEWTYLDFVEGEREKIRRVKGSGRIFGGAGSGALKNWVGDKSTENWEKELAMLDLNGKSVIPPHKRHWSNPRPIADPSNPEYLKGHIKHYLRYLNYGADSLQRDEVRGFLSSVESLGGGFTETGLAGFRKWLSDNLSSSALRALEIKNINTFDYGEYLRDRNAPAGDEFADYEGPIKPFWIGYWREVSVRFFRTLIAEVKEVSDKSIKFSCNNTSLQLWDPEHLEFDFAISELLLGSANPEHIWSRSAATRSVGKFQIFGSPKTRGAKVDPENKKALTRKVIATAYASGMASRVPWDIFQQTRDGTGRYFGEPKDYADLYAFVSAQDWNGYDHVRAAGKGIHVDALPGGAIQSPDNAGIYAFLNAKSEEEAPILIHLVDWGLPEVAAPSKSEMDYLETYEGERIYFSENGWENLKRTDSKPFTLVLDSGKLPLGEDVELNLLIPNSYEAIQEGEGKVKRMELPYKMKEGKLHVNIAKLNPWGILEIQ